jgi:hypothetical protein
MWHSIAKLTAKVFVAVKHAVLHTHVCACGRSMQNRTFPLTRTWEPVSDEWHDMCICQFWKTSARKTFRSEATDMSYDPSVKASKQNGVPGCCPPDDTGCDACGTCQCHPPPETTEVRRSQKHPLPQPVVWLQGWKVLVRRVEFISHLTFDPTPMFSHMTLSLFWGRIWETGGFTSLRCFFYVSHVWGTSSPVISSLNYFFFDKLKIWVVSSVLNSMLAQSSQFDSIFHAAPFAFKSIILASAIICACGIAWIRSIIEVSPCATVPMICVTSDVSSSKEVYI